MFKCWQGQFSALKTDLCDLFSAGSNLNVTPTFSYNSAASDARFCASRSRYLFGLHPFPNAFQCRSGFSQAHCFKRFFLLSKAITETLLFQQDQHYSTWTVNKPVMAIPSVHARITQLSSFFTLRLIGSVNLHHYGNHLQCNSLNCFVCKE